MKNDLLPTTTPKPLFARITYLAKDKMVKPIFFFFRIFTYRGKILYSCCLLLLYFHNVKSNLVWLGGERDAFIWVDNFDKLSSAIESINI